MGIDINLSDMNISDNARVLNNVTIRSSEDVSLNLNNLKLGECSVVLDNLTINSILDELNKVAKKMDKSTDEYSGIHEILKNKHWNKDNFITCITKHMSEFSQGVLASIVANILTNL